MRKLLYEFERWCGFSARVGSMLAWVTWVVSLHGQDTSVGGMLLSFLVSSLKYYPEKNNIECLLLKQNWKNVQNRFEQWFKRTWLEEQVLLSTIWTSKILNIPESVDICPNVGKYSTICITLWICLDMPETLLA